MFLIASSAMLIGLLFGLGVERRAGEVGLLLAVGYPVRRVRNRLLAEGGLIAALGALLGLAAGVGYAGLMMIALRTLWIEAVGSSQLYLHVEPASLALGWAISIAVIVLSIFLTVRRLRRVPPPRLLAGSLVRPRAERRRRVTPVLAWAGLGLALVLLVYAAATGTLDSPALAFGSGSLLLISGLAFFALWCRGARRRGLALGFAVRLAGMAARNSSWSPGRSILIVALVACACFVIVAVAANKHEFGAELEARDSGAGGYTLIAEAEVPVHQELGLAGGRAELGLTAEQSAALEGLEIQPLRYLPGDDASCLNLYRPEQPRLLGVPPQMVARGGFRFTSHLELPEGTRKA
jgi:predicted lysophospholipase L1 biosynthesis ABC-type transport system permease subunit